MWTWQIWSSFHLLDFSWGLLFWMTLWLSPQKISMISLNVSMIKCFLQKRSLSTRRCFRTRRRSRKRSSRRSQPPGWTVPTMISDWWRITESEAKNKVDAAQKWALGKPHFPTFIERYMRYIWYNWISSDFKAKLFCQRCFLLNLMASVVFWKTTGIISREVHKLAGICRNITLKRWLQMQSERSAGPGYSWSTWVSKGWMLMDVL